MSIVDYLYLTVGDEQPSSEDMLDVLSESADEVPVVDNETIQTSDVDSVGDTKQEALDSQPCSDVPELKPDDCIKG